MTKILVIRFSSIGDIVLTTPVIRALKEHLEGAELHYLTKKSYEPILSANPYIDKIHTISTNIKEVLPLLVKENFDFIVDLHKNLRSFNVRLKLGTKAGSFPKLNREKWLLVRFKKNILPDIHIVDRYFKAVEDLGVKNDNKGLDYFIPEKFRVDVDTIDIRAKDGYIAFVIGAKHYTKTLPEERIIEICNRLDSPVLLLGGPEDEEKASRIAGTPGIQASNCCGKFNINGSASIIEQAKVVITHDTGLMHIASAFRKKIISVWGNTVPAFGMYPYLPGDSGKSIIFEVKDLPCRPCSKIGFDKCPKGHFDCMMKIDIDKIVAQAKLFLQD